MLISVFVNYCSSPREKGSFCGSSMDSHNWIKDECGEDVCSPLRRDSLGSEESGDTFDAAPPLQVMETKLYKRRWVMLLVFSSYSTSNAFMWLQYGIISDIFVRFYGTDSQSIDWLSMIYFLSYIVLILPVTWLLDKRGMREIVMVGSAFNCIGAWIKTGTAQPDMYVMALFGQFVSSVAAVFVLGIPSKLASLWFGEKEVSTACSIGVLGNQVCFSRWVVENWWSRQIKLA